MKCIEVKENLDAFFDNEVSFSESKKIESHLENCVSCQTEFENLQMVSSSLKRNLPVKVLSASLDDKILGAFQDFHLQKQKEEKLEKIGWFGIPKFAFATAFLLLALFSTAAFQIGKMSASNLEISMPEVSENKQENFADNAEKQTPEIKIVEIPVVKEKIVEVPVIKEKIVTRTVYINKKESSPNLQDVSPEDTFALNSSIKDGEFLTTTNLEGFQPVAEIKAKITKKEVEK